MKPSLQAELANATASRNQAMMEVAPLVEALCNPDKYVEARRQIRRVVANLGLATVPSTEAKMKTLLINKGFMFQKGL